MAILIEKCKGCFYKYHPKMVAKEHIFPLNISQ